MVKKKNGRPRDEAWRLPTPLPEECALLTCRERDTSDYPPVSEWAQQNVGIAWVQKTWSRKALEGDLGTVYRGPQGELLVTEEAVTAYAEAWHAEREAGSVGQVDPHERARIADNLSDGWVRRALDERGHLTVLEARYGLGAYEGAPMTYEQIAGAFTGSPSRQSGHQRVEGARRALRRLVASFEPA